MGVGSVSVARWWVGRSVSAAGERASAVLPALCAIAVALAYGPLAFFRFAHTDDYALLMIHGYRAVNPFWIGDGRVLGGLICAGLFTLFDTVSSAAALRLIGLAEFLCCLMLIQRAACWVGLTPGWAAVSALLFAASPSIQNWMVWGVSSWQLPALLLGLLGYSPWRRMFDGGGRLSWRNAAAFVALQVAAMLVYQPFALAAWPFVALALAAEPDRARVFRRGAASFVSLGIVLVVTFAITKGMTFLFVPPGGHDRTAVTTLAQLPAKAWWLATVLYPTVLSYVGTSPIRAVYIPAAVLILLNLASLATAPWRALFVPAVVGAGAIAAALPSLVTPEYTPIRTFVVPSLLACVLAGSALQFLSQIWRSAGVWVAVAAGVTSAGILAWASYTTVEYSAIPQAKELAFIESKLARDGLPEGRPIVLVGPPLTASLAGRYCGVAMIGCASSSRPFALPNMVRLWLRDSGQDVRPGGLFFATNPADASVFSFEPDRSKVVPRPTDAYVVDFSHFE